LSRFERFNGRKLCDDRASPHKDDLVKTIAVCGTGVIDSGPPTKLDDSAYEGLVGFRQAIRRFLAFSETPS
jgi:hypothetical protein